MVGHDLAAVRVIHVRGGTDAYYLPDDGIEYLTHSFAGFSVDGERVVLSLDAIESVTLRGGSS